MVNGGHPKPQAKPKKKKAAAKTKPPANPVPKR
jgi:hypothetical protein